MKYGLISGVLLGSVVFGGCETSKGAHPSEAAWAATVMPADPVADECVKDSEVLPKPAVKDHNGEESAVEYKRLRKFAKSELARADRCRLWARAQR